MIGTALPSTTATVAKTTDVHSGPYAALVQNKVYAPVQQSVPVVPGLLSLGSRVNFTTDGNEYTGTPYTGRPTQVSFYYKLTGVAAADLAAAFFSLTRNVGGTTQTVAFYGALLPPAAAYARVTLPITYLSALTPDSVHLTFTSSNTDHPTVGTSLYIDDVVIGAATPTAAHGASPQAAISVAPNPSADGRFTLNSTEPALLAAPYTVTDATGRLVAQGAAAGPATSRSIELGTAATGIYTLQLRTGQGLVTRKLVVR